MSKEYFPYFTFNANLEFEKKSYHLKITIFFNGVMNRREFEVSSEQFTGPGKLLVFQILANPIHKEWVDINTPDNSVFVQEIGQVILKHNI
jgi:hypothetical protein